MASRPILFAFAERMANLGGFDYVEERLLQGKRMRDIAEELGVSRGLLYTWIASNYLPDGRAKLRAVRETQAALMADESIEIADETVTRDQAMVNRVKIETRQWLAGAFDRATFGKQPEVNISIQAQFLDALKSYPSVARVAVADFSQPDRHTDSPSPVALLGPSPETADGRGVGVADAPAVFGEGPPPSAAAGASPGNGTLETVSKNFSEKILEAESEPPTEASDPV